MENNIFCTKYLEIEMILCYEVVINAVLDGKLPDHVNASKVDDFKQQFIDKMNERKEMVILRRLKKMYENKLSKTVYNTKQHIDENIYSLVSDLENLSIDLESFKTELNNSIESSSYETLLEYCTLEHNEILNGIGRKALDPTYRDKAIYQITSNTNLQHSLRKKLFNDFIQLLTVH